MKRRDIFKVGVNWQVVIPQEIRNILELHKGDYVSFNIENGKVVLKKVILKEVH